MKAIKCKDHAERKAALAAQKAELARSLEARKLERRAERPQPLVGLMPAASAGSAD